MTSIVPFLLTIAAAVPVEATTLEGDFVAGELTVLTGDQATIMHDGQPQAIPLSDLQELRLHEPPPSRPPNIELRLSDGSHIAAEHLELTSQSLTATSLLLGEVEIHRPFVTSVRLAKMDTKVASAWAELQQRESRDDLVVVRKGDALDHVEGVVSSIDNESVRLLLDGSPVPLPRERVFGVILAAGERPDIAVSGHAELMNGDRLSAASLSFTEKATADGGVWGFVVGLSSGPGVFIAAADVARIDFSLGKIVYLSETEPATVVYPTEHELFLLDVWKYRRGKNSLGDPLEIRGVRFDRGLWIHSGTTLTYRLGREYRSFRAVAGIADGIGESCDPTIGLVIRGDGEEVLSISLSREEDPRDVELDVSAVRNLEIEVTSTDPDGVCEHLGLGDPRVIK